MERNQTAAVIADIAGALGAKPGAVIAESWSKNRRRTAAHCFGKYEGKPFFAKVLLNKSYPLLAPIALPDHKLLRRLRIMQSGKEQIETEWTAGEQLSSISRAVVIPKGIARSRNVIVWEYFPGAPLDSMVKQSWTTGLSETEGSQALTDAGSWLRGLHESCARGVGSVDLGEAVTVLLQYRRTLPRKLHGHVDTALSFIEFATEFLNAKQVYVSRSLTHGDFSLPNLLWDAGSARLAVVDYEHAAERTVVHDLVVLLCNLRAKLLNPVIPASTIERLEASFWRGYGPVSRELAVLVNSLASAWVFYHFIPKISLDLQNQSWMKRVMLVAYEKFLQEKLAAEVFGRFRNQLQAAADWG